MSHESLANLFTACLASGIVGSFVLVAVPATRSRFVNAAPVLAAAVAVAAMLGSLYFSERAGFIPCELCWYQRIAMYPLAIILPIAAFRRDTQVVRYSLVLASIGLVISAYHVKVQLFPEQSNFCEFDNPCSATWVKAFGAVTIPQMAGLAFALIIGLSIVTAIGRRDDAL